MKKLVCACAVLTLGGAAFAADPKPATPAAQGMAKPAETMKPADAMKPADTMKQPAGANAMAQWKAPKVTKEDKKGVDALYKAMDEAWKSGNVEAVAANIDFPVTMATDSSTGATMADSWTKEKWVQMMKPAVENMPKDMKMKNTHKTTFISDNMAMAIEEHTMTMGKQKQSWKSASMLVKKGDKWMVKMMAEGGWGDMMGGQKGAAAPTPPATGQTAQKY
jgi:hypothetical protein